jgi:hypothetical protein
MLLCSVVLWQFTVTVANCRIENFGDATFSLGFVHFTSIDGDCGCWSGGSEIVGRRRRRSLCMETVSDAATVSTLAKCQRANISNSRGTEAIRTAKRIMADCLYHWKGVSVDLHEAALYSRWSADQGNQYSQLNYGRTLEHGNGISIDLVEAARYYKLSADQGDVVGQFCYDRCLELGRGIGIDASAAARYFKLSADDDYLFAVLK